MKTPDKFREINENDIVFFKRCWREDFFFNILSAVKWAVNHSCESWLARGRREKKSSQVESNNSRSFVERASSFFVTVLLYCVCTGVSVEKLDQIIDEMIGEWQVDDYSLLWVDNVGRVFVCFGYLMWFVTEKFLCECRRALYLVPRILSEHSFE